MAHSRQELLKALKKSKAWQQQQESNFIIGANSFVSNSNIRWYVELLDDGYIVSLLEFTSSYYYPRRWVIRVGYANSDVNEVSRIAKRISILENSYYNSFKYIPGVGKIKFSKLFGNERFVIMLRRTILKEGIMLTFHKGWEHFVYVSESVRNIVNMHTGTNIRKIRFH